jgi:hypothetical protein
VRTRARRGWRARNGRGGPGYPSAASAPPTVPSETDVVYSPSQVTSARRSAHQQPSPTRHPPSALRRHPLLLRGPRRLRPPLLPLLDATAVCSFRDPPCSAGGARHRSLQALQGARGRGAARAERVHRARIRRGQARAHSSARRLSALLCVRASYANSILTDHALRYSPLPSSLSPPCLRSPCPIESPSSRGRDPSRVPRAVPGPRRPAAALAHAACMR